jgi:hypothetical protein
MDEPSTELLSAVREIRDLVRLLAEPAIAERDRKLRDELRRIVGRSGPNAKAVLLMDGNKTQGTIQQEIGINQGNLSTLVKRLADGGLVSGDGKKPRLAITIPADFFESNKTHE